MLEFFDRAFMRTLKLLRIFTRTRSVGRRAGARSSLATGSGTDFVEYRDYYPGADTRLIDWNIYGRLNRLVLKTYRREDDLRVHVLFDASASMEAGGLFDYARKLAAALGFLAVEGGDTVWVHPFSSSPLESSPAVSSTSRIPVLLETLSRLSPSGAEAGSRLLPAVRRLVETHRGGGFVYVISDFFLEELEDGGWIHGDAGSFEEAVSMLSYYRFDFEFVHVFPPSELMPSFRGDCILYDVERGTRQRLGVESSLLEEYADLAGRFVLFLESCCRRRGGRYTLCTGDKRIEEVVLLLNSVERR